MAEFSFSDDDREQWAEDAAAAMVGLSVAIRKKMLANIGLDLPSNPDDVFNPSWWEDGLAGPVNDQFAAIGADAASKFHEGAGWGPIPTSLAAIVGASVAAGMIANMGGRGGIVQERVTELVVQGQETNLTVAAGESTATERNGEWLSSQLALETGDGGPLSDKLMQDFGASAVTTLEHGAADAVLAEYDISVSRTWRASFINTRPDHADANGQVAGPGEPFQIGDEEGFFPGDVENLSDAQTCNCICWLDYDLPDEIPQSDDGEAVPSEDMADESAFSLQGITGRSRDWALSHAGSVAALASTFADAVPTPTAAAPAELVTPVPDYSDSVCVTVEPTAAEKQLLAVPGGLEASDLHCTLCYLGKIADLDDAARLAITGVLAQVAQVTSPFEGDVAGVGWFGAESAITVLLVDGDGLAALRTVIADLLIAAGITVADDHDLIPHITAGYSQIDAADKVGMPLHFNELRLRFGTDVLAFDLMGPIETAPEQPELIPELAPAPDNLAPTEAPMTVTDSATFDDNVIPDASAEAAPADLTAIPTDVLTGEMARRAADQVVAEVAAQSGVEATADQIAVAAAATEEEAAEIMDDLTDAAEAALGIVDPDATPDEEADEVAEGGTPAPGIAAASRETSALTAAVRGTFKPFTLAADLSGVTDDELTAEIARRAGDRMIEQVGGADADPMLATEIQSAAAGEAADLWDDLADSIADAAGLENDDRGQPVGNDDTNPDDAGEPVGIGYTLKKPVSVPTGSIVFDGRPGAIPTIITPNTTGTLVHWDLSHPAVRLEAEVMDAPVAVEADKGRPFAVEGNPPAPEGIEYEWEGILCVEGVPTDDGRMMGEGSISWRQLPLPLTFLDKITQQHQMGEMAGTIHFVERRGAIIWGAGTYADNEAGNKLRAYLNDPKGAGRYGVSADIGGVTVVYSTSDGQILDPMEAQDAYYAGENVVELMTEGTLMGATAVLHPALMEANIWSIKSTEDVAPDAVDAVLASGADVAWQSFWRGEFSVPGTPAVVASGGGLPAPPKHLFGLRNDTTPEPFTVEKPLPDGTVPVYGLLAEKGTCHTGFGARCVPPPASNDFRSFYTGKRVLSAEGDLIPVGPIIMDTVHPNKLWNASDTQAFYADTGCAVADVRLYRTKFGIVAAGVLSPFATPAQVYRLRASDVSPDWRSLQTQGGRKEHKVVAVLAVPCSGFIVEGSEALVASGGPGRVPVQALVGELIAMNERQADTDRKLAAVTEYALKIGAHLNREKSDEALAVLMDDGALVTSRKRAASHALRVLGIAPCPCDGACSCN